MVFSPYWWDAKIDTADDYMTGNQLLKFHLHVGYLYVLGGDQGAFRRDVMKAAILDDISEKIDELYKEFTE